MTIDPIVSAESIAACPCGARAMWRPVLFEPSLVRACMACGAVQMVREEWEPDEDPHGSMRLVAIRMLTLDADTAPWLAAWPRVVRGVGSGAPNAPSYVPASLRARDAAELEAAERAAVNAAPATQRERILHAGIPGPPARRDMRFEVNPFLDVHDILSSPKVAPIAESLRFVTSESALVRTLADEYFAHREGAFAALLSALAEESVPRPLALRTLIGHLPRATSQERDAFAHAVGARLEALVAHAPSAESEIDVLVASLIALGSAARSAKSALENLASTDLASRRSTLRDAIDRARRAMDAAIT